MEFIQEYITGIKNPILVPKTVRVLGLEGARLKYLDFLDGREYADELYFYHGRDQLVLDRFKLYFPLDKVGVVIFNDKGNLYLQKRGLTKQWEPGKIDLLSVVGAVNAKFENGNFVQERAEEAMLREINEETGLADSEIKKEELRFIGEYFEPTTATYLKVFAYRLNIGLAELERKTAENGQDDIAGWVEQPYAQTMREYFGDGAEKYAGGAAFRPTNFVSEPEIRQKLDEYCQSFVNAKL